MAARQEERCYEIVYVYLVACKRLSNNDVGMVGSTVFHEMRRGDGFKTSNFVNETLGGLPSTGSNMTYMMRDYHDAHFSPAYP